MNLLDKNPFSVQSFPKDSNNVLHILLVPLRNLTNQSISQPWIPQICTTWVNLYILVYKLSLPNPEFWSFTDTLCSRISMLAFSAEPAMECVEFVMNAMSQVMTSVDMSFAKSKKFREKDCKG